MDALNAGGDAGKRPAFAFREPPLTADTASSLIAALPTAALPTAGITARDHALVGPSARVDPLRRPVRGDLAHIRCAGQVFVPHYAVPVPRRVGAAGASLRKAARADAEVIARVAAGTVFNVLDLAGRWAWGQVGEDGFVGYLDAADLDVADGVA